MRVINKDEYALQQEKLLREIAGGAVFIYPTDTLYGLGCDATDKEAIERLRALKGRKTGPFSVIVPGKAWVRKNCEITPNVEPWLEKIPGAYTLILTLKNRDAVAENVAPGRDDIGIRIPNHWIADLATLLNRPIVTTSANLVGKTPMYTLEDLHDDLRNGVDFVIYEGERKGTGSALIRLTGDEPEVKQR